MIDPRAEALTQTYAACGGPEHRVWPRGGGLEDQDAGTVAVFVALDGQIASAQERQAHAFEASARRGGGRWR